MPHGETFKGLGRVSEKQESDGERTELSFWEAIGLPEPKWIECDDPPAVDFESIQLLVRKQLSERSSRMTYRLIYTYKNWYEAFKQIVGEEARRSHQGG